MNLDYGLKLELNQKLIMTPELRQAIAILQLSSLELSDLIEEQLQENPLLEIEEASLDHGADDDPDMGEKQDDDFDGNTAEWLDYLGDEPRRDYQGDQGEAGGGPHENVGFSSVSLHDHLERQLNLMRLDQESLAIGAYLIGCIGDNGYLTCQVEEVAELLHQPEELVERMLHIIQTFDPSGVGARNLPECLRLQLMQRKIDNPLVTQIIDAYLNEVAAGRCKWIAEQLGVTPLEVQEAVDLIKTMNPKPGRSFGTDENPGYILPDVTVKKVNGRFLVLVNDSRLPRLTINPYYRKVVHASGGQEAKKFIESRLSAAIWLLKSIEQRRQTLQAVMEQIVVFQHDFFAIGPRQVKPLIMKQIADATGLHESTVSRTIANKYAATPHGLFALRTFFSSSVHSATGEDVAASKAKDELKKLIATENEKKPYSDQRLTELLEQNNIVLSRRTVAKYREELGIPSSAKRKRY